MDYKWIRYYAGAEYRLSDHDCEVISDVVDFIYPQMRQVAVQSETVEWEYRPPYSIWVVEDRHDHCVRGRRGQSKDSVLTTYLRMLIPKLAYRLFLIHGVQRELQRFISRHTADLRPGHSKCVHDSECVHCGDHCIEDVYDCGGTILCGKCRYILRNGREPAYAPKNQLSGYRIPEDEFRETTHTIQRWRPTKIESFTHYRVLMEIEREEMTQAIECGRGT